MWSPKMIDQIIDLSLCTILRTDKCEIKVNYPTMLDHSVFFSFLLSIRSLRGKISEAWYLHILIANIFLPQLALFRLTDEHRFCELM